MTIAVCVCTHDRPDYLRDCLQGLRQQTAAADCFDILVIDSASHGDVPAQIASLVATQSNIRLIRVDEPGVSRARNVGAEHAVGEYIAYIDDDAVPAADWIECIRTAIAEADRVPVLIGGRILPRWEVPLPSWWPVSLRGTLSIIEFEGRGEYRSASLPAKLEPYGANMVVHGPTLRAAGGFGRLSGRDGKALLSDEEVELAWRLQAMGHLVCYDSRIVVRHQIQAARLTPGWLLSRQYWQGVSTVRTRRILGNPAAVWKEFPRRLAVAALLAPFGLLPRGSNHLVACRWRLAYAAGFIRAALSPTPGEG